MREIDLGGITAYSDAKKAGYTGDYENFCADLARLSASAGVTAYPQLMGKPSINGVELVGNLTSADLGLHTGGSRVEITTPSVELYGQQVTLTDGDETIVGQFDNTGKCIFESVIMGGTMIASSGLQGRKCYAYVQCPYFTTYKTQLVWSSNGVYSFIIDHSTNDLNVEYADDAYGMTAGSDDWLINEPFNHIRPCLLRNGEVVAYLDKNDYTKDIDGNSVTIQDVDNTMIEIPRMGVKAEWIDNNRLKVSITTGENVDGFDYTAFSAYSTNDSDTLYISTDKNDFSIELDDKYVTRPNAIRTVISTAKEKGDGYFALGYSQRQLVSLLCILFNKRVDITDSGFMGMNYIFNSTDYLGGLIGVKNSTSDTTYKIMIAQTANDFITPIGNNEPEKYVSDITTHEMMCSLSIGWISKPLGNSKLVFYPDVSSTALTKYGRWFNYSGYSNVATGVSLTGGYYTTMHYNSASYKEGSKTYYKYYAYARQMYLHRTQ